MEIYVNSGDHKYFGGLINVDSMQQKQEMMKGLIRNKSQIQFYSYLFNNNVQTHYAINVNSFENFKLKSK